VIDAKDRIVMRYDYDLLGNPIHQASMEAGERLMLNDVAGNPLYAWDSRNHQFRTAYDPLRRPTDSFLREGAGAELRVGRTVYGETRPNPEAKNLRGKVVQLFDQAGVITSDDYDFKGNPLSSQRQLAQDYKTSLNWPTVALEIDVYTSRTRYDALNRPTELTTPDSSVIRPGYNEANLLERVEVNLRGATVATTFITDIDYDAKGLRTLIDYATKDGKLISTNYKYDRKTFRLIHLYTRRGVDPATRRGVTFIDDCDNPQPPPPTIAAPENPPGGKSCGLQNLHYTYDPVGNITHIRDDAQQTLYFRNQRVEPSADYTYDAIYRLIEATGREHLGQVGGAPIPHSYNDSPRVGLLQPGDGNAMGTYRERYIYDVVGNFLEMQHRGNDPVNPGWTRSYNYFEPSLLESGKRSNRLTSTTVGGATETYSAGGNGYDAHGNMLRMPQLQIMQWDFQDQLQMSQRQAMNVDDEDGRQHQGERTWYVYDAGGQRVRKVTELATGQVKDERIYLGDFEIYRRRGANSRVREALHVMDDKQRVALVETRTHGNEPGVPVQLTRYQFANHLGSASLELNDQAQIISYEEYTPYGSTSYQAVRSQTETPKRYRYTGMERDEESGLSYHEARYYAPWIKKWLSCDPAGSGRTQSLYEYCSGNPIRFLDPNGQDQIGGVFRDVSWDIKKRILSNRREQAVREQRAEAIFSKLDTDRSGRLDAGEVIYAANHWKPEVIEPFLANSTRYTEDGWAARAVVLERYHASVEANWRNKYRQDDWHGTESTREERELGEHRRYQARLKGFENWQGVVGSMALGAPGEAPRQSRGAKEYQYRAALDPARIKAEAPPKEPTPTPDPPPPKASSSGEPPGHRGGGGWEPWQTTAFILREHILETAPSTLEWGTERPLFRTVSFIHRHIGLFT
jgi:RHS repeat-associated protein